MDGSLSAAKSLGTKYGRGYRFLFQEKNLMVWNSGYVHQESKLCSIGKIMCTKLMLINAITRIPDHSFFL